jgi:tetratricopeptide (TPR) repeat protein
MGIRMALFGLALAASWRGELGSARTLAGEGLAVCREIGDRWFISYFLWILAGVATALGDYRAARAQAEESLQIARELEGPLLMVCALDALADVTLADGDEEAARAHLLEAEAVGRDAIIPHSYLASVLRHLGEIAAARGDAADARSRFEESLALAHGVGDAWEAERTLSSLSQL